MIGRVLRRHVSGLVLAVALAVVSTSAYGVNIIWIGGNANWVDGGGNDSNWNPADEPDVNDAAVFNTANSVNLGSNNSVNGLTMSGGIDLFTNDFDLTVDGLVQLTGASTNLFIGGAASELNADNLTINSGGTVELSGGTLTLDEESGTSLLDINAGGTLSGHGVITFADTPLLATTLLSNDGTLTALSRAAIIINPPPVGTLQINDSSVGGRVDLDGVSGAGIVNVNRNQTLDLNVPLSDAFSGTMNLFQSSKFDSSSAWRSTREQSPPTTAPRAVSAAHRGDCDHRRRCIHPNWRDNQRRRHRRHVATRRRLHDDGRLVYQQRHCDFQWHDVDHHRGRICAREFDRADHRKRNHDRDRRGR